MARARIILVLLVNFWLIASISSPVTAQEDPPLRISVVAFEVLDLAVRIDEPKLSQDKERYVLTCAVANRSNEQLLGLRLVLLLIDQSGKIRARITWSERTEVTPASIKTFQFQPQLKESVRKTDRAYLIVEEVTGQETIWRVLDADEALRAFARGENDVIPQVRTIANKFDPRPGSLVIREEQE